MKFFTRGWVHGDMTDEESDAVAPAYRRYLAGLKLPTGVRALADVNPHDAKVLGVKHSPRRKTLKMSLRCGNLQVGYSEVTLDFVGVTIRPDHLKSLREAIRPADFEVLYDEVDRSDGAFTYRLLFHPVIEINFTFTGATVTRKPVEAS